MVADPSIDAIWLCGPNHSRVENVEEIVETIKRGRGELTGIACEKPLARNVAEATRVTSLVKRCGLNHGYLENQVFAPQVEHGRNLLWARGARPRDGRIWRAPPRSTAGRTCPGSGRGACRAAACSTT